MSAADAESLESQIPVVGLGASAGGLEALRTFFQTVPADLGAAYVVIVHLSPDHRSELPSILARETAMPVVQVGDHDKVHLEPDHVYVIAPDRKLELTDSSVGASRFDTPRGQRAAIDLFFRSLCTAKGAIYAVILSGGGTDGSVGAKAVKEAGGLVLVQDPQEAAHDSMPRAAIATEVADLVLPVGELTERLAKLIRERDGLPRSMRTAGQVPPDQNEDALLRSLLDLIRRQTGHDFSKYKRNTVLRRLARRMQLNHQGTVDGYLRFLQEHPEEVQALFSDLLITVTAFWRDPEAWTELRERVIAPLLQRSDPAQAIRCWVPGCATGEEAYTLAMLFCEEMEHSRNKRDLIIFASDVDDAALAIAREGIYPSSIAADVSDARLRRWFTKADHHYQVIGELRDKVVFASHSLQRDPPFSRLHLVSCRNLLIYLERELQDQVMEIFRYACRGDGHLFLGPAESAIPELFDTVDAHHRIYRVSQDAGSRKPTLPDLHLGVVPQALPTRPSPPARADREGPLDAHQILLEEQAPPSVVVDGRWNVRTLSESAGRFFQPRGGRATHSITETVRLELRGELIVALRHAFESGESWLSEFVAVRFNGSPRRVAVLVQPRPGTEQRPPEALVTFLEGGAITAGETAGTQPAGNDRERELIEKLHQAEQHIAYLRGEHHASEEDLRAANEELQSLNEEYRSTAEELETSKEELQSINEELQTVNMELKAKLEEVSRGRDDLDNLMTATDIPTLFLDRQLRIKRFTPQLRGIFSVKSPDAGRFIGDITHNLRYDTLQQDARNVLERLVPVERQVVSHGGQTFIIRMRPYRTTEDRIEGVVMTLVDVTHLKRAEADLRLSAKRFGGLLEASSDVLYIMNPDWTEMRELEGGGFLADVHRPIQDWMDEYILPDDHAMVNAAIQTSIRRRSNFELEHRVRRLDGSIGWTHSRAVPVFDDQGNVTEWFGAASDVTARKVAEQALKESDRTKNEFLAVLSHELRNPLAPLHTGVELLKEAQDRPDLIENVRAMMERQLAHLVRLVDDLLDLSRITRNQIRLQRARLDLNSALEGAIEQVQPAIDARGHTLIRQLSASPLQVFADPERITQIAANLLTNATRYTDPGGTISITSLLEDDHAVLRVRDNGYGIPADSMANLFALFTHVPEHRKKTGGGGLGIGLALCKRLVEMHGGVIAVRSDGPGHGAEFEVRLPLDAGAHGESRRRATDTEPATEARRILVVEDNADAANALAALLRMMGHTVDVVGSGEAALEQVASLAPDALLLDLGLPGVDGLEVARRIRALPEGQRMVLIAMTGWGQADDMARTRAAGFDDHLVKPIALADVNRILSRSPGRL